MPELNHNAGMIAKTVVATLMLFSGACNMLILKYADMIKAVGNPPDDYNGTTPYNETRYYAHPIVQGIGMFGGETICLILYYLSNTRCYGWLMWKVFGRRQRRLSDNDDLGLGRGYDSDSQRHRDSSDSPTPSNNRDDEPLIGGDGDHQNVSSHNSLNASSGNCSVKSIAKAGWDGFCKYIRFFVPSFLDCIATVTVFYALNFTFPSSAQMLRGSVQIFRFMVNYATYDRRLPKHKIIGLILVTMGLTVIVGTDYWYIHASGQASKEFQKIYKHILFGDVLVILAQISTSFQIYYEEFSNQLPDNIESVAAVGWEGVWGVIALTALVFPFSYLKVPGSEVVGTSTPNHTFEDVWDALTMMKNDSRLLIAAIVHMISVCIFNMAGITYVQMLTGNGMWRMAIDTLRTIIIWSVSILCEWENFVPWQVFGFVFQITGLCWFNGMMLPRFLYPAFEGNYDDDQDSEYSDEGSYVSDESLYEAQERRSGNNEDGHVNYES